MPPQCSNKMAVRMVIAVAGGASTTWPDLGSNRERKSDETGSVTAAETMDRSWSRNSRSKSNVSYSPLDQNG